MMIDFRVEPERVRFFSRLRKKDFSSQTLKQAQKNLLAIKKSWFENIAAIDSVLEIFPDMHLSKKIIVSVFPSDYFLGAAETNKQLILYGQPSRSKSFSTALIVHEITHIFLSKIKLRRAEIIDEIICFLVEGRIHFLTEKKGLEDIWNFEELSIFHKMAMQEAIKYSNNFIMRNNIKETILFLKKNTSKEVLETKKIWGLTKNIGLNV